MTSTTVLHAEELLLVHRRAGGRATHRRVVRDLGTLQRALAEPLPSMLAWRSTGGSALVLAWSRTRLGRPDGPGLALRVGWPGDDTTAARQLTVQLDERGSGCVAPDRLGIARLYADDPARPTVVGSRASLVRAALEALGSEVDVDPVAAGWMAGLGRFPDLRTPYRGVSLVPWRHGIEVEAAGMALRPRTATAARPRSRLVEQVADEVQAHVDAASELDAALTARVTGDGGSRVVLAALESHPDAVLEVAGPETDAAVRAVTGYAAESGHRVRVRRPEALEQDAHEVRQMVRAHVRGFDGMGNLWDVADVRAKGTVVAPMGAALVDRRPPDDAAPVSTAVGSLDRLSLLRGDVRDDLSRRLRELDGSSDPTTARREQLVHRVVGLWQEGRRDQRTVFPLLTPWLEELATQHDHVAAPLALVVLARCPGALERDWAVAAFDEHGLPPDAVKRLRRATVHPGARQGGNTPWQLAGVRRNLRTLVDRILGDPRGGLFDVYDREAVARLLLDATNPLTSTSVRLGIYPMLVLQEWAADGMVGSGRAPLPTVRSSNVPRWWYPLGVPHER